MSKVWKVVSTVAIVALILGALCILAGFVTGGDVQRCLFYTSDAAGGEGRGEFWGVRGS